MAVKFSFLIENLKRKQGLAFHRELPQIEMEIQTLCRKFILHNINKLVPDSFLKCFVPCQ